MKSIDNDLGQNAGQEEEAEASIDSIEERNENPPALSREEKEVKKLHRQLVGFGHKELELAIQIGEKLQALKGKQGHGKWEEYVEKRLGIKPRTASNYLRVAKHKDELIKSEDLADLTLTGALALIHGKNTPSDEDGRKAGSETTEESAEDSDESSTENPEDPDTPATGEESTEGEKTPDESKSQEDSKESHGFVLADGSQFTPRQGTYVGGLLSRETVVDGLKWIAEKAGRNDLPKLAARQRIFIRLASGLNQAVGKVQSSEEIEQVCSVMKELQSFLEEVLETEPQQKSAA